MRVASQGRLDSAAAAETAAGAELVAARVRRLVASEANRTTDAAAAAAAAGRSAAAGGGGVEDGHGGGQQGGRKVSRGWPNGTKTGRACKGREVEGAAARRGRGCVLGRSTRPLDSGPHPCASMGLRCKPGRVDG